MKRKTVVVLLTGLLLSLTLALYSPSASAHPSTYCGHGHSGVFPNHTHYRYTYWEKSWHYHVYRHYLLTGDPLGAHTFIHDQHKVCPGH
jgi:hypothetical protein